MGEFENPRFDMRVKSEKEKVKSDGTSSRGYEGSFAWRFVIVAAAFAFSLFTFHSFAHAATADLSITQSQITFSKSTLYENDVVRIYARVRNLGESDMTATVFFYQGAELIGNAQPISLLAGGAPEEVFIDYTVPSGSFNIRAIIQGATPADENASNDEATTPLYTSVEDADRDGVLDDVDNCPSDSNADQLDTDGDGAGNVCDGDDDGDEVSDTTEVTNGTDPVVVDEVKSEKEKVKSTDSQTTISEAPKTTAVATSVADSDSPPLGGGVGGGGSDSSKSTTSEETTDAVTAPTSAYAKFAIADTTERAEAQGSAASFFTTSNPWLQALVAFCTVIVLGLCVLIVAMRRRHDDDGV